MDDVNNANSELTMKKLLFVLFIFCSDVNLFAQIEPVQNKESKLIELNVKSISSFYYASKDTVGRDAKLVFKKEFNLDGNVANKYILSLWEAVSYENTSEFIYNKNDQLIEETKVQMIINLGKRDEEYIEAFGNTPLNEKRRYAYNKDGELVKKEIFIFSTHELSPSAEPSQKVLFEYDSGLLQREINSSPNIRVFNKNFTIDYEYDDQDNIIKKILTYGAEMDNKRISEFTYNLENRLVEEKVSDSGIPRNNAHVRYEYNELGLLKSKLVFDIEEEDFVVDVSYEYDPHGNQISGEKEVEFTYYDNGLIRSELWKDAINDQVLFFVSTYEYY